MGAVTPCVILLGGSFDPIHNGHLALGSFFVKLLRPDQFRVIPAGSPWQKHRLQATAEHRIEMVRRAFSAQDITATIDCQEIERQGTTYTIDTLRAIRAELGPQASIVFLMGADQLQQLDTWREWRHLFDYAHLCAASRPGFALQGKQIPAAVTEEFARRAATPEQIRSTPYGMTYLAPELALDISATEIRAALQRGDKPVSLVPPVVLDYIQQYHLYKR